MTLLGITLFGEPRFAYGAAEHRFEAPPRTLPLLTHLLLHRETVLDRQGVANALWPDVPEDEARANLRRHLHYLKRALPPLHDSSWLELTARTVAWNTSSPYTLDVADFERESRAPATRAHAASLYTGDLFERCSDEWIDYDRQRLRNLQLSNLTQLMEESAADHDDWEVAAYATRLLALDPWREDVIRTLMAMRARAGDRAGAIAEYERFASRLSEHMGVDPMPETTELLERIRAARNGPKVHGERSREAAFVGRESELETLHRSWHAALGHHAQLVLIGGEAGAGKTSLIAEFAQSLSGQNARMYWGATTQDQTAAYDAFRDILTRVMPQFAEFDALAEQSALFTKIGDAFEALALEHPLLLVLEDLHWAGDSTALLLQYLFRRLHDARVMFAGTYRDEEVSFGHPIRLLRRNLARSPVFTHLPLCNLEIDHVRVLARQALGEERSESILEDLYARSDGNPFFVGELLRAIVETGAIAAGEKVEGVVEERLTRVSPAARAVVQHAAVFGAGFELEQLCALTGLAETALTAALNELCDRRIVRTSLAESLGQFAFSHQLIAQVVYDTLPPDWRRTTHARIAQVLESLAPDSDTAATIAYHADNGELASAPSWYCRAARRALDLYANAEALRLAQRAIELRPDDAVCYGALLIAEEACRRLGNRERQEHLLEMLEAVARTQGNEAICEVLVRRIAFHESPDQAELQRRAVKQLLERADENPYWHAHVHLAQAELAARNLELHRAIDLSDRAAKEFGAAGSKNHQALAYVKLIELPIRSGDAAQPFIERAKKALAGIENRELPARLLAAECLAAMQHDYDRCYALATELLEITGGLGDRRLEATAHQYFAAIRGVSGEIASARKHFDLAQRLYNGCATAEDEVRLLQFRAAVETYAGNFEAAIEYNLQGISLAQRFGLPDKYMSLLNNTGEAYAQRGDFETARRYFHQALGEHWRRGREVRDRHTRASLGALELEAGNYVEAIEQLQLARAGFEPREAWADLCATNAKLAYAYLCTGDTEAAREYVNEARQLLRTRVGKAYAIHETLFEIAAVLHGLGDLAQARSLAARAHALALDCASRIDASSREQFLATRKNRQIVQAVERGEWPRSTILV